MQTTRRPALIGVSELPALCAVLFAFITLVAVFLPWYQPNLGGPLTMDAATGWHATSIGKATALIALFGLVAGSLSLWEQISPGHIDRSTFNLMGWLVTAFAALCVLMTGYRFLRPPPPADFLTREWGLFVAVAASVAGVGAGLAMTRGRRPRTRASARRRALRGT